MTYTVDGEVYEFDAIAYETAKKQFEDALLAFLRDPDGLPKFHARLAKATKKLQTAVEALYLSVE